MIKNTCQCSKKLVRDSLYKKWHCIFKHLLISCDDTVLTPNQNDDAIQSHNCVSPLWSLFHKCSVLSWCYLSTSNIVIFISSLLHRAIIFNLLQKFQLQVFPQVPFMKGKKWPFNNFTENNYNNHKLYNVITCLKYLWSNTQNSANSAERLNKLICLKDRLCIY